MNLAEISFPVYKLRNEKPLERDGILFYTYDSASENEDGELEVNTKVRIIDDKKIENEKLSMRRLVIKMQGGSLFRLNKAIFFLGDLIKIAKKDVWFIDSNGKLFEYQKTTRVKLKFHKIKKLIRTEMGGALVEVEGIPIRLKSLFFPENDKTHAGILHYSMSPILYGFYDDKYNDTWRMV